MAAYFIVDLDVHDPAGFREYQQKVGPTLEQYGGKYIVRGGATESLEENWPIHRLVILEFASVEQAKRWYNSEEYTAIKDIRLRTAHIRDILVQGVQ